MSSRLFQYVYKELVRPLVTPKKRFSADASNLSASKKKPTDNNEKTMTILKVIGGFVPGVYIGHVLSEQGVFDSDIKNANEIDPDEKDALDSAKDKLGEAKEKVTGSEGDDGKDAKDAVKDKMEDAKDKAKDVKDKVTGSDGEKGDDGKDAKDAVKDKMEDAKDKAKDVKDKVTDGTEDALKNNE